MNDKVQAAMNIIGYTFNDPSILWEALNVAGSGVVSAGGRVFLDGNKRFAVIGDSTLRQALHDDWYPTGQTRGQAQNRIDTVASNANLAAVGFRNGLDTVINTNPSQGGHVSPSVMATTVEAIIGAIWWDSHNLDTVKRVMTTLGL